MDAWIAELIEGYSKRCPQGPKLDAHWKRKGKGEDYSLFYAGGTLTLKAESSQAAIFGIGRATLAALSGHIADNVGEFHPKFPLRPCWLVSERREAVSPELSAKRLLFLGYNAVVLPLSHLELAKTFGACGVKVILHTGDGVKDEKERGRQVELLSRQLTDMPFAHALFWESSFSQEKSGKRKSHDGLLLSERILQEVKALEKAVPKSCRLIYCVPCADAAVAEKQAAWLPSFLEDVGKNTVIAFPSVAGAFFDDGIIRHPLWEKLRCLREVSCTPLLPIVNIGQVGQGEGLWPILSGDLVENYLLSCGVKNFAGAIIATASVPQEHSYLSCNLRLASEALWGRTHTKLAALTWLSAYRPEKNAVELLELMLAARSVQLEIARMLSSIRKRQMESSSSEADRQLADSLFSQLRVLQARVEADGHGDAFTPFIRDARKMLLYVQQTCRMPLVALPDKEDLKGSFWADMATGIGQGIVSAGKVALCDKPNIPEPGTAMRQTYDQVFS